MFLLFSLIGCQPNLPPLVIDGPSIVVDHAWGQSRVPLAPKRIVVLDLPFLDALTSLEQPVAGYAGTSQKRVPHYLLPYFPDGVEPVFVGERKQPNLEVILSLDPELIIANPDRHKLIKNSLETLAPTIAFQDNSIDQVRSLVDTLGLITQRQERSREVTAALGEAIEKARSLTPQGRTVMVIGAFEDEFSTWTATSFIGTLMEEVGMDYLFTGPASASESQTEVAKLTIESLSELNPSVVFLYGSDKLWLNNPIYRSLACFSHQQIHHVDRDLWSRARGPLAALEILKTYERLVQTKP